MDSIFQRIAAELNVRPQQVTATVKLLDEGATVPFIARYRKEITGALDDTQLRNLEERLHYLRDMEERRNTILTSIREQEKLTPELEKSILEADTKTRLEDLYLPYKPKRRTKAQIAREAGLEPLADDLLADPTLDPEQEAIQFINAENNVADTKAALDGAKYILMEKFSEDAELLGSLRKFLWEEGRMSSCAIAGKEQAGEKFRDYFEHNEPISKVPSHRALAIFRGRNEGFLQASITIEGTEDRTQAHPCEGMVARCWQIKNENRAADKWLHEVVRWTWRVKLLPHIETELMTRVRESAEKEAIKVFSKNMHDLLLAAPAGPRITLGLDPGLRTGVKVAVVDSTGKLLDHTTIFPHVPQNRWNDSLAAIAKLTLKHNVELIAIGNGTASRETDRFAAELIKQFPKLNLSKVVVSESGASIYSASETAAKEFPDLDVTFRGAVSIARRLQDPLAELVKIDPKAIGVGQYQHDVNQTLLARSLDGVVEDCVNAVGVDVNMASGALLTRVAGLNTTIANNIVEYRNQNGAFLGRDQLKAVPRLGDKTFEQCAGFLRIMNGDNPLDSSAVHPETYPVVQAIAARCERDLRSLIGDTAFLRSLNAADYTSELFGIPTVTDIISELDKPGRDPRPEFKTAMFQEGVEDMKDLKLNMELEGVVTNVTNFGAFVDIGIHQDGLVHISALSNTFIKDPREVVKAGDVVRVKVMGVDIPRRRIALSMRMSDIAESQSDNHQKPRAKHTKPPSSQAERSQNKQQKTNDSGTFANLFANAKKLRR
ncbi:MAG: RNA-binding transcriptional accessory protein [Endozoicomonadaceae bacterium]|nr:RNA-binding transcriptional accessory protein [Endozoicomonadaceae bacterium]